MANWGEYVKIKTEQKSVGPFEKANALGVSPRAFVRCVAESNHCNRFCRPAPDHSANAPLRNANIRHFSESTRPFLKHFRIFEETNDSLR